MKFDKPPLSFEEQAEHLLKRGMQGDRSLMIERLRTVSYYRLSGYWYTFRHDNPADRRAPLSEFKPGTTFEAVWERYVFDRRLRLLVMDAVERIEVSVRSLLATHHALRHGPFAYAEEPTALPLLSANMKAEFVRKYLAEQKRSKDTFAKHFKDKHGDSHDFLPIWMAAEIMSFGALHTLHQGCHQGIRKQIALPFGVHDTVFESWLLMFTTVRNICAHHGRLWNREIGTKPKIPDKLREWQAPIPISGNRVFAVLTICKWCLDRVAPQSRWPDRLSSLLNSAPSIPLVSMGFPARWETSSIWSPKSP